MPNLVTAIVVDDESNSRFVLKNLLEKFTNEIEVIGEAGNVEDAFTLVKEKKPHLVFLDIQMPKANGFALLKKFDILPFEVIFVTSYDKYALNAIKFSALDYLLKPIETEDLTRAIGKAVKRITDKSNNGTQVINLLHNLNAGNNDHKVAVHNGDLVKFINEKDILYIEADGSYCIINTEQKERFVTARNLKDFEEYFGDSSSFVRLSRSCLINANHVKQYSKGEPCIIDMADGKCFEIPRRKKAEILERLKAY